MWPRQQLPVWTPVTARSVAAGLFPGPGSRASLSKSLGDSFGAQGVLLTGSGTAALALAYRLSAPGGERPRIALPAWACPDLLRAAESVDAEVRLYDLDPGRLAPDEQSFLAALAAGIDAAVVVHGYGIPVHLEPLRVLVDSVGAILIDDAAQAAGTEIGGHRAGAGGDYGIVSFGRGKGRGGAGGGALLAMTDAAVGGLQEGERLLEAPGPELSGVAVLAAQWALGRPSLYGIPAGIPALGLGETRYRPPPPISAMGARAAAVAMAATPGAEAEVLIRRHHAGTWTELLTNVPGLEMIRVPEGGSPGWLRFPVLATGESRERLLAGEARRRGVAPGYPRLLHEYGTASARIVSRGPFPGARDLVNRVITLPTHHHVSISDFHHVSRCVQEM